MRYFTTTLQPNLILEVENREADGLRNDGIIVDEFPEVENEDGTFSPPSEYTDQQERIKEERLAAIKDAHDRGADSSIEIRREDGTLVGQPDAEQVAAAEQAGQAGGDGDGESLTGGSEVAPDLVSDDKEHPQPDAGGKRVRRGTSAKAAE